MPVAVWWTLTAAVLPVVTLSAAPAGAAGSDTRRKAKGAHHSAEEHVQNTHADPRRGRDGPTAP